MKMNDIMNTIMKLSLSQGYWGRVYHAIRELECTDYDGYLRLVDTLENEHFASPVDLVMYFEA